MKYLLACLILMAATVSLSGCYYDPGYSYVRSSGYNGDAYYGQGAPTYYAAPGYYDGYYPGYYGYGYYGCCHAPGVSVGISSVWYGGSRYYRPDHRRGYRDYRGGRYRGHTPHRHPGVRAQTRPSRSHAGGDRRDRGDRRGRSDRPRN